MPFMQIASLDHTLMTSGAEFNAVEDSVEWLGER